MREIEENEAGTAATKLKVVGTHAYIQIGTQVHSLRIIYTISVRSTAMVGVKVTHKNGY